MLERFETVCKFSGQLMLQGKVVYSPIAHNHPIACLISLPRTWDWWKVFDEHILSKCDSLMVLMLDGWDTSIGVAAEIDLARTLNLPISFHVSCLPPSE